MSWQLHRRLHGIPEMGQFPLLDPKAKAPDASLSSYVRDVVERPGASGSHLYHPRRIYECPKTGRTFAFWDNYRIHAAGLARLPGELQVLNAGGTTRGERCGNNRQKRKVTLPEEGASKMGHFLSPRDGVVFCRKGHLRVHQAALRRDDEKLRELNKKIDHDYPIWAPQDDFLAEREKLDREMRSRKLKHDEESLAQEVRDPRCWGYRPTWPRDPDDLFSEPLPPRESPRLRWSHSAGSESWFLDHRTPCLHDEYAQWYEERLGQKTK